MPVTESTPGADAGAAPLSIDLFTDEVRVDPYPLYRELRATEPIVESQDEPDTFILLRYQDCLEVLRDPRWSSNPAHRQQSAPDDVLDVRAADVSVLLFLDPPDHTRLRKLVSKAFTPRTVERMRPRIQALVDTILDEAAERGSLDVVGELGYQVPVTVICELMGVPVADRDMFGPWSSAASRLLDGVQDAEVTNEGLMGVMQIVNYFNNLFDERRADPQDDLITALLAAEADGDRLDEEELRSIVLLLFIAGHETTMNLIGNGTKALLEHPDQLRRLTADPAMVPVAVEELLRFDGPVHLTARIATEPLTVGGRSFATGDQVIALLAAANRDPARYERPDELDVGRTDNQHLTFSHGIHYCLGAALARIEGQVVLGSLIQRFPEMELLTDPLEYRDHFVLRGLRELRVRV
jgi:cytochrome P450